MEENFDKLEKKIKKIEKRLNKDGLWGRYTTQEIEVFKKKITEIKELLNTSNKDEAWAENLRNKANEFNKAVKKASGGRVVSFFFLPLGWIAPINRAYSKAMRKLTGTTLKEGINYFPY